MIIFAVETSAGSTDPFLKDLIMFRSLVAISTLLIATSAALPQTRNDPENYLRTMASKNTERTKEQFISRLFLMSPTGELTREMAETIDLRNDADMRMRMTAPILKNDLDGDGKVSREEIKRVRMVLSGNERSQFETAVLKTDTDGDGKLSAAEIAATSKEAIDSTRRRNGRGDFLGTAFMVFDADGNGVVVVDEIIETIDRLAAEPPSPLRRAQLSEAESCKLPKPSPEASAVFVAGRGGSALSSVSVAGPDQETTFATLDIEEGKEPLYIVANISGPMVLRVTGATGRVERFVGGGNKQGLGVIGLPAEVVDLTSMSECKFPVAYQADTSDWIKARALLVSALGKEVRMTGRNKLDQLKLPSGHRDKTEETQGIKSGPVVHSGNRSYRLTNKGLVELKREEYPTGLEAEMRRFYPDGVVDVSAEDIVASGKAEAYDVLPSQAGLIQLVKSGALSVLRDGAISIDKPIPRFPAGLNGAHSVKFVLRRGVPMPAGSPGHSMVLLEETGQCLGARC